MAKVSVRISFRELLREICSQFSTPAPIYGFPVENEGLISVYVEIQIPKGEDVFESIRCWSAPSSTIDAAEEDVACTAVNRLRHELSFEVKDVNMENMKFYENLYGRITTDYNTLRSKHKRLRTDYNLLKGYYSCLLTEKECADVDACPSEQDPVVPPDF